MVMRALRSDPQHAEVDPPPSGDSDTTSRLDAFPSESEVRATPARPEPVRAHRDASDRTRLYVFGAMALALLIAVAGVAWMRSVAATGNTGSLRVETDVDGADVTIDGTLRGKTPLLLPLTAGIHELRVQQGPLNRTLSVSIAERTSVVHHIGFSAAPVIAPTTGGIEITSEPRGQNVTVDGQPRGVTPLTVTDLAVGQHEVIIRRDATLIRRTVQVEAGATASLMVTPGASGLSSGWLEVSVPIALQIYEGTQLVGSTESGRLLVPAGGHTYDLTNEALGFRMSQTVQVAAGQTASVSVTLPRGTINVNAVPWAEVWIDGQPLGETPIGNVAWTIGAHDIVLRHPQLGERRVTTTITTREPARVAVDMRNPQ